MCVDGGIGSGGGLGVGGVGGGESGKNKGLAYLLRIESTCLRTVFPDSSSTWYETGPVTVTTVPGNRFGGIPVKN